MVKKSYEATSQHPPKQDKRTRMENSKKFTFSSATYSRLRRRHTIVAPTKRILTFIEKSSKTKFDLNKVKAGNDWNRAITSQRQRPRSKKLNDIVFCIMEGRPKNGLVDHQTPWTRRTRIEIKKNHSVTEPIISWRTNPSVVRGLAS